MKLLKVNVKFILACALLAAASASFAGVPNNLTYQGRVQESGVLVNGNRDINIGLCANTTNGGCPDNTNCLYSGNQTVSVTNGLFRTTFTVPSGVDMTFPVYLEVREGAAGGGANTCLAPREALTISPYAIVAGTVSASGILGGNVNSLVNFMGGNVGIGTASPGQLLEVSGALTSIIRLKGATSWDLRANGSPNSFEIDGSNGRSFFLNSSGFLGLGNVTPSYNLDVTGMIRSTDSAFLATNLGSVGIGTQSPLSKLHVFDGDIRISTTGLTRGIFFQDNTYQTTAFAASNFVNKAGDFMTGSLLMGAGSTITVTGNAFSVGGSTLVVKNGSVGIGTTNPFGFLDISTPSAVYSSLRVDTNGFLKILTANPPISPLTVNNPDGNGPFSSISVGHPTGDALKLDTGEDAMSNIGTVRLHFGQFNLSSMAEIQANNEGGQPTNRTAGLSFWTEPPGTGTPLVERMRLTGTGNVGIGTQSPASKLDVLDGDIRISTTGPTRGIYFQDNTYQTTAFAAGNFVNKAGDFMTGSLLMGAGSTITVSGSAFSVGGSTLVVKAGNVGIGTINPAFPLHVFGSAGAGMPGLLTLARPVSATDDGNKMVFLDNSGGSFLNSQIGGVIENPNPGTSGISFWTTVNSATTEKFRMTGNGRFGVRTSSPSFNLDVLGVVRSTDSAYFATALGSVGIGTTNPALTLDVYGGAQFGSTNNKSTFTAVPGGATFALQLSSGVTIAGGGSVALSAGGFVKFGDGTTQATAFSAGGINVASGTFTQTGNNSFSLQTSSGIFMQSGTLQAAGTISATATGNNTFSIISSSGINVLAGGIFFNGNRYNNPDYVFEPKYPLMPLGDVRAFVASNKHLPHVASTKEVSARGVEIFEQNRAVLENLEASYLYIFQLDAQMKEQRATAAKQEADIEVLKAELQRLKAK